MGKKAFIALILVSVLVSFHSAPLIIANPYEPPPFYPPAPTKDLPTIFVVSPANATYNQNNITLNIFIIQPSSWQQGNMTVGYIRDVFYTIDGRTNILWDQMYNPPPTLPQISNFSAQLDNLTTGNHSLLLIVSCYSVYDSHQSVNWHMTDTFWFNATQKLTFTVNDSTVSPAPSATTSPTLTVSSIVIPSPSPSPTPTAPFVFPLNTPSPSPTPQPTIEPSLTASPTPVAESGNPSLILEIAVVIAIVAIIVGLLVYFRKRRG